MAPDTTLEPLQIHAANEPSIIKGYDDNTPYLGFNEFYSMRVLQNLGVAEVANTRMPDDSRVLIVDRFDVAKDGNPIHGVEDICGLLGLPPHESTTRRKNESRWRPKAKKCCSHGARASRACAKNHNEGRKA
jgi:hypothetical protein